uniref:Prokaryotic STING domain-containing protein n=1 Tax=Candidatus Kentrum sp. MB TaxID=2138164 RepID=A0A450WZR5_9GAMM|nr:MAG: hypothetical protein BECKMB1821G_GA0114241_100251 [Candidatus Kentron sp. MB]
MPKRCFVIGPMKGPHMDTLKWLAYDVVEPLLPPGFEVKTPDSAQNGNVITHVIKSCDRAHLVIANTTGNNPNVFYEMAVLDAMGRACIPVKIVDEEDGPEDLMPLDRAAYRYFTIHRAPDKRKQTDEILSDAIKDVLDKRETGDMYQNPLTDFLGMPLGSLQSARGLARGYYLNLLKPSVDGILNDKFEGTAYDGQQYSNRVVEIIIPDRLEQASRPNVQKVVTSGELVKPIKMPAHGREITLYEWGQQTEPTFRWLDIPTTMASLKEMVEVRLGNDAHPDPTRPEFQEIEQDEIEQFEQALQRLIWQGRNAHHPLVEVKVLHWKDTKLGAIEKGR